MKILIIAGYFEVGGASKSITNIINSLKDIKNIQIKTLTQKFQNKLLASITLDSYLSIPYIIKDILKFKPDIIITQGRIAFPTILVSKLKKIPVINIIRSTVNFCPKYVDIVDYGKACSGINNRKKCFKCIDKWRTLRILIGNRPKGSEHSIKTSLVSVLYKIRYFMCLFNLHLIKKANINLVASELMIKYFSHIVNKDKFKVVNITPIQRIIIDRQPERKHFIFIRTDYETSHKGLDFIKRLSKLISKPYWIIVIGGNNDDFYEVGYPHIIYLDHIFSKELFNEMLSESMITLVPTFCTEAFGRVIPESLVNRTPVISSPQCGANQFFEGINDAVRVVPLKLDLWIKTIEDIIINPPIINNKFVNHIYRQFSLKKSREDFIKMIKEVLQ